MKNPAQAALIVLAALWAGMIAGVSLLATPVKFLAPSLSMVAALEVGRHTFNVFSYVEIVFVLAVLGTVFFGKPSRLTASALVLVGLLLLFQRLWLLPALDTRVGLILKGETVPPSFHHHLYAFAEGFKVILLLAISVLEARLLGSR